MGYSVESWLKKGCWVAGTIIYGWLFTGLLNKRDYPNLTFSSALGPLDLGPALLGGLTVMGLAWFFRRKKTSNSDFNRLFRIVVAVLPALFVVSALATLVLTLATYNGDWVDARQGLATAFAALIAAVGVVVSVAVSYQTSEENRLAQQENLRQQLEHQREIEDERAQREQHKQDAEIIKSLNDRLHEILSRRYSTDENERSASYFQLATLYQDWETLAASSEIVRKQKNSQQKNILKILFGVPQQDEGELVGDIRSDLEVMTLNSVIQDIFTEYTNITGIEHEKQTLDRQSNGRNVFDLSFLDLRFLSFSKRDLMQTNLTGAHLEGANLEGAHLEGACLVGAHLEEAYLVGAHLEGANFQSAHLNEANLLNAHLESSIFRWTELRGAGLIGTHLDRADLRNSDFTNAIFLRLDETISINVPKVRSHIIDRIASCKYLPERRELLESNLTDEELVDEIIAEHKRRRGTQEYQ